LIFSTGWLWVLGWLSWIFSLIIIFFKKNNHKSLKILGKIFTQRFQVFSFGAIKKGFF